MPAVLDPPATTTPPPARPGPFAIDIGKLEAIARAAFTTCRPADEPIKRLDADVLTPLREWARARPDAVQAVYLVPPVDGVFWVYVVGRQTQHDPSLGAEVARLCLPMAAKGWNGLTAYLPGPVGEGGLTTFFDPATAGLVHANG